MWSACCRPTRRPPVVWRSPSRSWPNSSTAYFAAVQGKLQVFINSGQLGIFANGYWGHPAYKLPPEGNLLAVAHYLEALDWQREVIKMHAILGGKNPHPQTYLVGGMATPVDPASPAAINPNRIAQLRSLAAQGLDFVIKSVLPRPPTHRILLPGVDRHGGARELPLLSVTSPWTIAAIRLRFTCRVALYGTTTWPRRPQDLDQNQIKEYVAHSWYSYAVGDGAGLHPAQGETRPNYTGPQSDYDFLNTDGKYSWLKAPRNNDAPMEVGPLARAGGRLRRRPSARSSNWRTSYWQSSDCPAPRSSRRWVGWRLVASRRWPLPSN